MRILHVVTLVSPDGAYGGPVRVAVNQAQALRERGHSVVVAAGTRGFDSCPEELAGVPVRLFPARTLIPRVGFAGLASPGLLAWFAEHANDFDMVHVHLARDLTTLPLARFALSKGLRVVVQTHGMIDRSDKVAARPLDAFLTRPVLRRAASVFHLTEGERQDLRGVAGGPIATRSLPNGVPTGAVLGRRSDPNRVPRVLFLARLHPRKRPVHFVDAALRLLAEGIRADFTLVGPDEGEGATVNRRISESGQSDALRWLGPLAPENVLDTMGDADLYVLPSVDEPYPMSVLEAMSIGLPVVVTDSNGLASMVRENRCGAVTDGTLDGLAEAMAAMLRDPDELIVRGHNGIRAVAHGASMNTVVDILEDAYGADVVPDAIT